MAESVCPSCGYCEKCGRKTAPTGQWLQPYQPYIYPVYPYTTPYWYTITTGTTGGSTLYSSGGIC